MFDVREVVGRPSLDTFYQVTFSFGKWQNWLESNDINRNAASSRRRSSGNDFMEKMSIMCAEAELPGTSFQTSLAVGHHQGIQEEFPNLRTFPPLNLTFYCDLDHVIIEVLESWMTYINPITGSKGYNKNPNAYGRFNYPEDYKETIHVTKFERDLFVDRLTSTLNNSELRQRNIQRQEPTSRMTTYEFINIWPTNLTSMRVAYGQSNVLRCSVTLAYDRFVADFNYTDTNKAVAADAFSLLNSKEQSRRHGLRDSLLYGNTVPSGAFGPGTKKK
tara:strand:+ start:828 stop:1652 length:825 start_codon:yes stop_codon:yes gene_type:complete